MRSYKVMPLYNTTPPLYTSAIGDPLVGGRGGCVLFNKLDYYGMIITNGLILILKLYNISCTWYCLSGLMLIHLCVNI